MEERAVVYDFFNGIVGYVVDMFSDDRRPLCVHILAKETKEIAALYGMSVDDVIEKIIDKLTTYPLNENGDTLSVKCEKKILSYALHVKLDDDEEED